MITQLKRLYFRHKALFIAVTLLILLLCVWGIGCLSTYIPRGSDTDYSSVKCLQNPAISTTTKLSVKSLGKGAVPVDTLLGFTSVFERNNQYSVSSISVDLYLTRDNNLVILSPEALDYISSAQQNTGKINPEQKSLGELLQYNIGYNYQSENGDYPYRSEDTAVRVFSLVQALDYLRAQENLWKKQFLYNFTLKNSGELGKTAAQVLYSTLSTYGILSHSIAICQSTSVAEFISANLPLLPRSATNCEAYSFYYQFMLGIKLDTAPPQFSALIIPPYFYGLNYAKKSLVDYAHKYGISVQFITDKNADSLSKLGVDVIISENPKSVYDSLKN